MMIGKNFRGIILQCTAKTSKISTKINTVDKKQ